MQRARRLPVSALNPHFTCVLCEGYIIDATTITECVHSFCRTCIVRYLEHNKYCPVCEAQVHETKPLQGIRFDQTLQDIVYKLIPGLYQNEMQRRRQFYAEHPDAAVHCTSEERGEGAEQKFFYSPDETISLTLEYHSGIKDISVDEPSETSADGKNAMTRYLNCPAALAVSQLKKFISMKFSLPKTYQVEIMYADHVLRDDDTLMDIAYIYAWKRAGPMKFHYNIAKRIPRRWEIFVPKISKAVVSSEAEPKPAIPDAASICTEVSEKQQNELEIMEVDEAPAETNQCSVDLEKLSSSKHRPVTNCDQPTNDPTSMETDQKMEITEPVNVVTVTSASPNTKPSLSTNGPMSYGTVKLVSTSDTNTILSTSNGVRLKLIHPPHTNPRGRPRKSKKKCKAAPFQKLARLAPYPPPNTPVPSNCLATPPMSHLPPLAVGKLVPSVMTSLAPALVTTLVSSTANTLCNASRNTFVPQVGPYLNQTNASNITKTIENSFIPTVLSNGLSESNIQQSSTFTGQNTCQPITCQSNVNSLPNPHALVAVSAVNSSGISIPQISSSIVSVDNSASSKEEPPQDNNVSKENIVSTSDGSPTADTTEVVSSVKNDSVSSKDSLCDNSVSTTESVTELNSNIQTANSNSGHIPLPSSFNAEQKSVSVTQSVSSVDSSSKMECEATTNVAVNNIPTSSAEETKTAEPISTETSPVSAEVKLNGVCNGVKSPPINASMSQSMFCKSFSMDRKATEAYENSVKNSISAEFSDNDDLGCQPDLVVDEQKMDSSDNEDDADTALRKKITAIAEKEDEADATDDTEADSGRASDISSQARSSCDDDIGSPAAPVVPANDVVTTSSSATQVPSFTAPVATTVSVTPATSEESHRPTKPSSLNDVIDNLYRQKKDNVGALDLSLCARKSGEAPSSRPKAVANPVLDIKHRQQAYLPAPNKQHTACPPAPKHPTSPSLLLHHLSVHHHNMMTAAQMAQHVKPPHLQVPVHCNNMTYPSPTRSSPSSVAMKSTSTYNNSHTVVPSPVPTAHQGMVPFLPSSFLQYNPSMLNSFAKANIAPMPLPGRSTPKTVQSSPPPNFQSKSPSSMPHYSKQSSPSTSNHRKSSSAADSHNKSPLSRGSPMSPPVIQVSHPRASPTLMRMLTQHRSASPAPCPKPILTTTAQSTSVTCTSSSSSSSYKPNSSIPIYKKADSYKNYTSKFRGSNLTVFNPDPNGYRQKIVIKNLDRTNHR